MKQKLVYRRKRERERKKNKTPKMAYCGSASKWAKIGLVFQYIGLALCLSGFGTIGWMVTQTVQNNKDITVGLFKMIDCSSGSCATSDITSDYQHSKSGLKPSSYIN